MARDVWALLACSLNPSIITRPASVFAPYSASSRSNSARQKPPAPSLLPPGDKPHPSPYLQPHQLYTRPTVASHAGVCMLYTVSGTANNSVCKCPTPQPQPPNPQPHQLALT